MFQGLVGQDVSIDVTWKDTLTVSNMVQPY